MMMIRFLTGATLGVLVWVCSPAAAQEASPFAATESATDAPDDSIVVTGSRLKTPALGALGDRPLLDTPFSASSYDAAIIKDIQANSLTDLTKLEPTATTRLSEVNEGSTFLLRGFSVDNYYVDSIPGLAQNRSEPPLELYQNVLILKGAAGFLYGFTSPGGVVNLTTKRPGDRPFLTVDGGFEANSAWSGHADASVVSGNGAIGTRLNVVGQSGRLRHSDTGIRRFAAGLNTDVHLGPTTTLQLDLLHMRRRLVGDSFGFYPESSDVPVPKPISGATRLAPDYSQFRFRIDSVSPALIQEIGADWQARLVAAWSRADFNYHDSEFDGLTAGGDYTLGVYAFRELTITKAAQFIVSGKARTGAFEHEIALGGYYAHETDYDGRTDDGDTGPGVTVGAGNIADLFVDFPNPHLPNPSLHNKYRAASTFEKALFASDTISIGGHWQVLAGGRFVWRDQSNYDADGTRNRKDDRHKLTPTAALLWKPIRDVTAYVSYAQSLQSGGTAPANAVNAGEAFGPIASKQYEAGVKAELGPLLATAAVFRIERGFEYLRPQASAPGLIYVQNGIERHDGAELAVSGRIGDAWRLTGGVQFLDPTVRQGDPDLEGKRPDGVPRFQAKLFAEYAPPILPGAALNASVNYGSGSYLDLANDQRLSDFATVDVGARYRLQSKVPITVRASVENIANHRYWLPTDALIPGAPRAVKLSATVEL